MPDISDAPEFSSYEELMEWVNTNTGKPAPEELSPEQEKKKQLQRKKTSRKKTSAKKPARKDEGVAIRGSGPDPTVWSSVHFYTQPGDSVARTRNDAKEEIKHRNTNVKAFYHDHYFGEECKSTCGEAG